MKTPKGYKVEKYESISAIRSEFKNIAAQMEKSGWAGRAILSRGKSLYMANVSNSGKLGKMIRVPA